MRTFRENKIIFTPNAIKKSEDKKLASTGRSQKITMPQLMQPAHAQQAFLCGLGDKNEERESTVNELTALSEDWTFLFLGRDLNLKTVLRCS